MTSWRPQTREPDPLRAALHDYLRNRAAQVFLNRSAATQPLGRADVTMSNGRPLAIDLSISPSDAGKFAERAAVTFMVAGHAAEKSTGYAIDGRVVLDRNTLAFLLIEVSPSVVNAAR